MRKKKHTAPHLRHHLRCWRVNICWNAQQFNKTVLMGKKVCSHNIHSS